MTITTSNWKLPCAAAAIFVARPYNVAKAAGSYRGVTRSNAPCM